MRIWPIPGKLFAGENTAIEGSDARHMLNVLRLEPGDVITVSDGDSKTFQAKIGELAKNRVSISVLRELRDAPLRGPRILLAVGVSKPQVMELAVQKAVELGCAGFFPLVTKRSAETSPAKIERLNRIIREALKQCGRAEPMELFPPVDLGGLPSVDLKIALWEEDRETTLLTAFERAKKPSSVLLAVGPAGGFTIEEIEAMRGKGFVTAGLGPLILRTETAAIALLSVANFHFGRFDFS